MKRSIVVAALSLSACATAPAVSPGFQLDPATRPDCAANCEKMGLKLAAVVLVRNSAGCVCAVPEAKAGAAVGDPAAGGSVAVAAGVIVQEDEESQRSPSPPSQR